MGGKRDWFKLSWKWYADDVLVTIADESPLVFAVWPVLIAMAKESSHHKTNPNGDIRVTIGSIASTVASNTVDVQDVLRLLEEGDLITISGEYGGRFAKPVITVNNFADWNSPRGSTRERVEKHRDTGSGALQSVTLEDECNGGVTVVKQNVTTPSIVSSLNVSSIRSNVSSVESDPSRAGAGAWADAVCDNMLPVLAGVDRESLRQKVLDSKAWGVGNPKRKYDEAVWVQASVSFAESVAARPLENPASWWNYFVGVIKNTMIGGEAVDADKERREGVPVDVMDLL